MRTHLLRAVYPSSAATEIEPDTGYAANDAEFARAGASAPNRTPLSAVVALAPVTDRDDDYYLGGYAGI